MLGVLAFLGLLGVGWHNRKRAPRLLQLLIRWVYSRLSQLRLRAKLKQLLTLCESWLFEPPRSAHAYIVCALALIVRALALLSDQVLTRIPEVFQLQLPVEVSPFDDLPCTHTHEQLPLSQTP